MNVRFLLEAAVEFDGAIDYYNERRVGLGQEFAIDVQNGIARLTEYPNAWRSVGRQTRCYQLNRFPFGLVYSVRQIEILIVAVMHLHRKPGYWRDLLTAP